MREKRKDIKESDLQGFKYFKVLSGLLERLHGAGCDRDRAHNRTLHMDQYISLILLYMFNPICTSLRALQQASELPKVQKKLGCACASLGSLSEAARVFDSERLKDLIAELSDQMPQVSKIPGLDERRGILTAVDGTRIEAVAKMAWATWRTDRNGIKVHTQFEILKGVPVEKAAGEGIVFDKIVSLGCRHLLSYCENGIELEVYAAIIACMLISLWTGRKPTLRTYEMIGWYFSGMATEEDLLAHIRRLQKQDEAA